MNVFIIAAISADGFIARSQDELADWTSKEDKKLFVELTKRAGVMVMGGTTFRTIGRALPGRRNIVYSRRRIATEGIEITQEPPEELLSRLSSEGYTEVAICGGRSIYGMFLKAKLVDEIFLTVEPVMFGAGIPLYDEAFDTKMQLKECRQMNDDTILINYEVNQ